MVYCKTQTDDFIKKYCFLYYLFQIGVVVLIACIVVFAIGFQSLRYNKLDSGAVGNDNLD